MSDLSIPILLLGIGMLVLVVVMVLLVLRQLLVCRSRGAFGCTLLRRGLVGGDVWQDGVMRFGRDRLRWFRAVSLRLRPEVVIRRSALEEVSRERVPCRGTDDGDCYQFTFTLRGGRELTAVVDLASGAALNSWLEAAPTGSVLGDAD